MTSRVSAYQKQELIRRWDNRTWLHDDWWLLT